MAMIKLLVLAAAFLWAPLVSAVAIHAVHIAKPNIPASSLTSPAIGLAAVIALGSAVIIAFLNRAYSLRVILACINAMFGFIYLVIAIETYSYA